MQKLINVLAVASFIVSGAVVAGGVVVYTQRDAIVEAVKKEASDAVAGMLGGSQLGSTLSGSVSDEELDPKKTAIPVPTIPF